MTPQEFKRVQHDGLAARPHGAFANAVLSHAAPRKSVTVLAAPWEAQ